MEYLSGYREVVHCPDIPSDDRTACREGSSGTMGIECYDSLVASNISRIRHARWGKFTASTREGNRT
ncbi:hypothetical protein J1N35_034963 [Gossypium stocksii]|uniref:Uncharacterized protein n=1 Tax=Gossypium stocksii TaxID=47602 RepID=A0A9D3UT09_9ROSI|nr:hypothetical protein J1N35_034963 [Gossypium stocksii]